MPNRHGQDEDYRYGFQGQEMDDEVRGTKGASYDFGARMLDPRIGRWLSGDAKERDYPAVSPYVFALNSPLLFKDPDGNDAVITVQKDPNGGGKIIISSTIYVTGKNASSTHVANLNKHASENVFNQTGIYSTEDGDYEIVFDIKYEYAPDESKIELKDGDNIMDLNAKVSRSRTNGSTKIDHKNAKYFDENGDFLENPIMPGVAINGNIAYIDGKSSSNLRVQVHETMHLLGLSDRYSDKKIRVQREDGSWTGERLTSVDDDGWKVNDIMTTAKSSKINQTHFNNWAKYTLKQNTNSFVLENSVDRGPSLEKLGNATRDGSITIEKMKGKGPETIPTSSNNEIKAK